MIRRLQQAWSLVGQYPFSGICTLLSVFFLLGSVGLWFVIKSLSQTQLKTTALGTAVTANLNSRPQLQQELAFVRQHVKRIEDTLAAEENLAENVNYFYNLEETTKVSLEELRPFNAPPPETGSIYKRVPFGLKVSGTFPQVATFLHGLETGPRLATINNFGFRKRGGSIVTVELTVDLLGKR